MPFLNLPMITLTIEVVNKKQLLYNIMQIVRNMVLNYFSSFFAKWENSIVNVPLPWVELLSEVE